jgi:kinesin family member 6/9
MKPARTGIDGTILREARHINLSLHYLEQVIVALQERSMGLSRCGPLRGVSSTIACRVCAGWCSAA